METDWPAMTERGPQITEAAIAAFEKLLGATLPDDYREFLLRVNGGQTATSHCKFTVWLHKRKDATNLNSLNGLDDPDDRANLEVRWRWSRDQLPAEVIPAGSDDLGGTIGVVVAGPRRGQIWFLDGADPRPEGSNPRVDWFDRRDVCKLADSFREFMQGLRPLNSRAAD
jgi:hypothetical protein